MAMLPLKVTDGVIKAFKRGQLSLSPLTPTVIALKGREVGSPGGGICCHL